MGIRRRVDLDRGEGVDWAGRASHQKLLAQGSPSGGTRAYLIPGGYRPKIFIFLFYFFIQEM
uniref:Uncharacterized protein n=1 Tax=Oryza punctata TaxID=4537 RepID=A0A0E0JQB5_ORYPU